MSTRRERVVLELVDSFSTPMARAAAAAAILRRELNDIDDENVSVSKSSRSVARDIDDIGKSANRTEKDIDKLSGRLRILTDLAAGVGPGLIPLGATAVAGLSGVTSQLGFATIGAGVAVLAFQDVGEALKAVNKAALEPTVDNLNAAQVALANLSPEARGFVTELRSMAPALKLLRDAAAEGLFPGLTRGLDGLESALPRVENLVSAIATELGDIGGDVGESLGSERWAPFLDFVAEEGPAALGELSEAIGNTAHGLAELWIAFDPVNDDFSSWLVEATKDFDRFASGLSQTEGFAEFVDYIETNGPQVAETAGAIANAFLQIAEAAAPLGGPALRIVESLADAIARIADSPLGTPLLGLIATMGALNTAVRIQQGLQRATFGGPAVSAILANDDALGRFGLTTGRANSALAGLKRTAGLAAVAIGGLQVANELLEKSDPTKPVNKYADAFAGLALGSEDAKDRLNGLFTADNSNWSYLVQGQARVDGLREAFEALNASDFTMAGKFGRSLFGTFDTQADLATSAVKKADEALAELAGGGNLDAAQKGFEYLAGEAEAAGMSTSEFISLFPQYSAAVGRAGGATGSWTEQLNQNTAAQERSAAAMQAAKDAARAEANEFTAFGDSLDDSKVSLGGWLVSLEEQAAALRDFTDNAKTAGERGLRDGLIKELEKAGPAGALRMKELADGTDREIRRANKAWGALKSAAKDYVNFKVPPKVITVDTSKATAAMNKLLALIGQGKGAAGSLNNLPKGKNDPTGLQGLWGSADGGTVPKTGLPYADRHLYLLADGEEVISNRDGQADRNRGLLKAINDNRLAGGGTAGQRDLWGAVSKQAAGEFVETRRQGPMPTWEQLQGCVS